ncbi:MAG: ABC transporter ATP-binding protein [Acholeplasmataceae bacterium]
MIELKDVSKVYTNGEVETHALKDVSFSIETGEFIVVLGPSGSGKSTMLNVMSGLDIPTAGVVRVGDAVISGLDQKELTSFRRSNMGFIFQQYNLLSTLTVYENVALGHHLGNKNIAIEDMLKDVGLENHRDKYPYQLSGGEQQRVSIARALIKEPLILFCDEPTGSLDEANGKNILSLLQELNRTYRTTIVLITHNPAISELSNRTIRMNSGRVSDIRVNRTQVDASSITWS